LQKVPIRHTDRKIVQKCPGDVIGGDPLTGAHDDIAEPVSVDIRQYRRTRGSG
jgi:hypothetical protein